MKYNIEGDRYTMHTRKYSNGNTRVDFSANDFQPVLLLERRYTVDEIYEIIKKHEEGLK